jgi:hypothetical protein
LPTVAAGPGGAKLVIWLQPINRELPQRYELWARALDGTNTPVAAPSVLPASERDGQMLGVSDAAVERASSGFLVVSAEGNGGTFETELFARRVGPSGKPFGRSFSVAGRGTSPNLAYNAERDDFLAVWNTRGRQIRARRLKSDGSPLGKSFRLWRNPDREGIVATSASVAYDPQHERYLAVWSGEKGPDEIVFGRTIPADGDHRLGRTRRVGPVVRFGPTLPDVAFSPRRGEFLLASHENGEVLLTRLDNRGRRVGKHIQIQGSEDTRASFPNIAARKAGDHVFAYSYLRGGYYRVLGRRLRQGPERRVWTGPTSYEGSAPRLTTTASGFGAVWVQALGEDDPGEGSFADREVFFRALSGRN